MQDVVAALAGKTKGRREDGTGVGSLDGRKGPVETVESAVGESVGAGDVRCED